MAPPAAGLEPSPTPGAEPTESTTATSIPPDQLQGGSDAQPSPGLTPAPRRQTGGAMPSGPSRPPADLTPAWCVIQRTLTAVPGYTTKQNSVARCDQVAGLGPDWTVVQGNLPFPDANKARDTLNAADPANVWCVMQRPVQGRPGDTSMERTVIRSDNVAGAGPGWTVLDCNLTFPQASITAWGLPPSSDTQPGPTPRRTGPAPLPPVTLQTPGLTGTPTDTPSVDAGFGSDLDTANIRAPVPGILRGRNPELIENRARQDCMAKAANTPCKRDYCTWQACIAKNSSPGLMGVSSASAMNEAFGACSPHWQILMTCTGGPDGLINRQEPRTASNPPQPLPPAPLPPAGTGGVADNCPAGTLRVSCALPGRPRDGSQGGVNGCYGPSEAPIVAKNYIDTTKYDQKKMQCTIAGKPVTPQPSPTATMPPFTGAPAMVLPVEPLPPPQMRHTPAPLPPAVLPPPQLASVPAEPDHVQPQPSKAPAAAKHRQPAPRRHVNRRDSQPAANNNDAAIAGALIGIAIGGAMRSGGGGGGGVHRAAPSGHHR